MSVMYVCHVMSCHVMSCHVMSCHVMSCHVMSCHVMSCHVMSCHVMSCHVMSCHVMSCMYVCMYVCMCFCRGVSFGLCRVRVCVPFFRVRGLCAHTVSEMRTGEKSPPLAPILEGETVFSSHAPVLCRPPRASIARGPELDSLPRITTSQR